MAISVLPRVFCRKKGIETKANIWAVNEQIEVHTESEKMGIFNKSTGKRGEV